MCPRLLNLLIVIIIVYILYFKKKKSTICLCIDLTELIKFHYVTVCLEFFSDGKIF